MTEIAKLVKKTNRLAKWFQESKQKMSAIDSDFGSLWNPNEPAKNAIRNLLDKKPNLDQIDITDELNLDLELVCQVCGELLVEGKIKSISY
ncbi:MAG TPA: hypothetical protein VJC37_02285 [Planctomycetota bacterium]|nr:hypothetical protein [Planctomycetota bacterium]